MKSLSRIFRITWIACKSGFPEWFVLGSVIGFHLLTSVAGLKINRGSLLISLKSFAPFYLIILLLGILAHALYEGFVNKRWKEYLVAMVSRTHLLTSLRILIITVGVAHFYTWLKLLIPYINPRLYDQVLWKVDRFCFFGLSPNVFFLQVFHNPLILRALDWLYLNLFLWTLATGLILLSTSRDAGARLSFVSGYAFLWVMGAWLYLLLPAMGPCYRFPQVWEPFQALLPHSQFWQKALFSNYMSIISAGTGRQAGQLHLAYGIAAFPSLHVASQFFMSLWARRFCKPLGFFLLITTGILFVGSIVTGWHYMVDSLAGLLLGFGGYALFAGRKKSALPTEPEDGADSLS